MLQKIIISPPFGEWIKKIPETSNVIGSLTVLERKGRYKQALKTIRPILGKNSWINKIGLRTKGIENFNYNANDNEILSIAAINYIDWSIFSQNFIKNNFYNFKQLEINVGCPNTLTQPLNKNDINLFLNYFETIIIKVPPKESSFDVINNFSEVGVKYFHLSNTYPTIKGGVSGEILKKINLRLINKLNKEYNTKNINLIAGGGIYNTDDVKKYIDVGAKYFSLSTVFYNPFKGFKLVKDIKKILKNS